MIKKKNIGKKYYPIETILKYRKRKGVKECLIKWKGYSPKSNSWEPTGNVKVFLRTVTGPSADAAAATKQRPQKRRKKNGHGLTATRKSKRKCTGKGHAVCDRRIRNDTIEYLICGVWMSLTPGQCYNIIVDSRIY